MTQKPGQARGLKNIATRDTSDPAVTALELTDMAGHQFTVAMNVHNIAQLIQLLLDQAQQPVFAAASAMAYPPAPPCRIAASQIELPPGRSASEAAVTMKAGALQFVAFADIDQLLQALAVLAPKLESHPRPPTQ
jgi:hypothetical protein